MSTQGEDWSPSIEISKEVGGRLFRGSYTVRNGIVEVHLSEGRGTREATQVGEERPEVVATWLFDELVAKHLAAAK